MLGRIEPRVSTNYFKFGMISSSKASLPGGGLVRDHYFVGFVRSLKLHELIHLFVHEIDGAFVHELAVGVHFLAYAGYVDAQGQNV